MSVPRLNPFEKTSVQSRHSIKRLEMVADTTTDEKEKELAEKLLTLFREVRKIIPNEYQDVDIK